MRGIRRGPWKLILAVAAQAPEKVELHQVETDIAERFNLAAEHPDIVAQLQDAMWRHQSSFQPALTQR